MVSVTVTVVWATPGDVRVIVPVVLRHWKLEEVEGVSAEAEEARTRVLAYMARLESVARRLSERRQAAQDKEGQLIDA